MSAVPLWESGNATVDAAGRAMVRIANLVAFEQWTVKQWTVSNTGDSETEARVYRNQESPSTFLEGTYSGRQDASNTDQRFQSGEAVVCVWRGATPGSRCVFSLSGEKSR